MRAPLAIALFAALLMAAPASGGPDGSASETTSVSVRDDFFSPRSKTASRGDTVSWRWRRTDNPHNVRFRKVPAELARVARARSQVAASTALFGRAAGTPTSARSTRTSA